MGDFDCEALDVLTAQFHQLPGIGKKTAQRLALFVHKMEEQDASSLAGAIQRVKKEVHSCSRCFNLAESELCPVCADPNRDESTICVVEDVVDIMAIEKTNEYRGVYHVLKGVISPLAGKSPEDLTIQALMKRADNDIVREILLALNPSTEGEATMIYISQMLKSMGKKVTRIASGIPLGAHLEFIDDATIGRAIMSRREI